MGIRPNQRIYDVVRAIRDEYRLPSIQRSFVWDPEKIYKLMDSILNDYPIGSFLVWKPSVKIRTRKFAQDYSEGSRFISEEEPVQPACLVLDGQQRLQSLYLSFFGSYDGKYLYFKADSNPEGEESDLRYQFQFLTPEQAAQDSHWIIPKEIVGLKIEEIPEFVKKRFGEDPDEAKARIIRNLAKFIRAFNIEERISFQEVEENLPYNDVLEVFVRVNSGGVILTKSDLVFSTIVLALPEMERKCIELVAELNSGGEFNFDIDFLIKASFVVFDKGAKFDANKLKDKEYVVRIDKGFENFSRALISTKEFLKTDAKILSKRFLKSDLALIPIVDFILKQPRQQLPEGQATKMRQYLYMSFFTRFYSYGADGKLDVIHKTIKESSSTSFFPINDISKYMSERTGIEYKLTEPMLFANLDLILNIIQDGVSEIPTQRGWSLERDHIFPVGLLKDAPEELVWNVGNFRLINETRNILKSDKLPSPEIEFFGSNDPEVQELFLKAHENLTEENFRKFVQKRSELIFNRVKAFLGL